MNAKLVKSMTAIFHCIFGIIATAGDKIKFSDLCDFEVSIILFRNFDPDVLLNYLCLSNQ